MIKTVKGKAKAKLTDRREFPEHPRIGVGGVVIHRGSVLLVRRGQAPLKGEWSIPGGLVEVGETLKEAVEREIEEETKLRIKPVGMLGVFERVVRSRKRGKDRGKVQYHYVIVDFLCELRLRTGRGEAGGPPDQPQPWTDVTDARWVNQQELGKFRLSTETRDVIGQAFSALAGDLRRF